MTSLIKLRWSDLLRERGSKPLLPGSEVAPEAGLPEMPLAGSGEAGSPLRMQKTRLEPPTPEPESFTKAELTDHYTKRLRASAKKSAAKGIRFEVSDFDFNHKASDDAARFPLLHAVKNASKKGSFSSPTMSGKFCECTFKGMSFAELSLENAEFVGGRITNCLFGETHSLERPFAIAHNSRAAVRSSAFDCKITNSEFINIDLLASRFTGDLVRIHFNDTKAGDADRIVHSLIGQGTSFQKISESRFRHVRFAQVEFGKDLDQVQFIDCEFKPGSEQSRLKWPDILQHVAFQRCQFFGVDFSHVKLVDCKFGACTFVECRFAQTEVRGTTSFEGTLFRLCDFAQTTFGRDLCGSQRAPGAESAAGCGVRMRDLVFERCRVESPAFREVLLEAPVRFQQCEIQNVQMTDVSIERGNGEIVFEQGSLRGMKFATSAVVQVENARRGPFCLLGCSFDNVILGNIPCGAIGLPRELNDAEGYFCRDERRADQKGDRASRGRQKELLEWAAKFYGQLSRICLEESNPVAAGEFFFRMMEAKRKAASGTRRLKYQIANLLCGYGERLRRVVSLSVAVLLVWACGFLVNGLWIHDQVIYYGLVPRADVEAAERGEEGVVLAELDFNQLREDLTDALRLSANVFTSMGDETIRQPNRFGSMLVATESFLGVFVTALFVSVLFRKIAR